MTKPAKHFLITFGAVMVVTTLVLVGLCEWAYNKSESVNDITSELRILSLRRFPDVTPTPTPEHDDAVNREIERQQEAVTLHCMAVFCFMPLTLTAL
jgi:hypothetical protein